MNNTKTKAYRADLSLRSQFVVQFKLPISNKLKKKSEHSLAGVDAAGQP
jgi:hypothetical protein